MYGSASDDAMLCSRVHVLLVCRCQAGRCWLDLHSLRLHLRAIPSQQLMPSRSQCLHLQLFQHLASWALWPSHSSYAPLTTGEATILAGRGRAYGFVLSVLFFDHFVVASPFIMQAQSAFQCLCWCNIEAVQQDILAHWLSSSCHLKINVICCVSWETPTFRSLELKFIFCSPEVRVCKSADMPQLTDWDIVKTEMK